MMPSIFVLIRTKIRNLPAQPCCGYFLYGGTRVVGLLDFGFSFFAIILITSEIYQNFYELLQLYQKMEYIKYYFRAASWVGYFTFKLFILGLSIFLFRAAKKRNPRLCKIWMILSTLAAVGLIVLFYINHFLFRISVTVHVFIIFYIFYKLYCLYVVWSFVQELESYGGFNVALSGLTDAEVEEFEKGCPPERENKTEVGLLVQNQAFNKDFEIRPENLEIDETSLLGSGAYGSVYRGKLKQESGEVKCVAVKTVNQNADVTYFKTLLSELKVMTFVSQHENIVSLVGACTANIKQKKLYIVVEFCPYGNLHEYLKARRGLFVNLVKDGEFRTDFAELRNKLGYTNINPTGSNTNTITNLDILRWMYESSKGLEVLEAKKVVHGDIAARNILLGFGKTAKISDFGLSKKLYQYTTVVKEATLLPWRWMALESLSDMEFSVKSDVWSFATTMWEAFSLSELPFPGFSWDKDFVNKIREGLRMKQPRNATNQIYELMVRMWKPVPKERPSFREIREVLEGMLHEACQALKLNPSWDDSGEGNDNPSRSELDNEVEIYIPSKPPAEYLDK